MSRKKLSFGLKSSVLVPRMMKIAGIKRKNEFAAFLGIAPQSMNKYKFDAKTGEDPEVPAEWLVTFELKTRVPLAELVKDGEGDDRIRLTHEPARATKGRLYSAEYVIPYAIEKIDGNGEPPKTLAISDVLVQIAKNWMVENFSNNSDHLAAFVVSGDNMYPTIKDNSLVLIDKSENKISGDGVYAFLNVKTGLMIRRVKREIDGTVDLKDDNPIYGHTRMDPNEVSALISRGTSILGRVVFAGNPMR